MINIPDKKINYVDNDIISVSFFAEPHILPHRHREAIEIVYCLNGSAFVRCANEEKHLSAGDFYIINFSEPHCVYSDEPCILSSVCIDFTNIKDYSDTLKKAYFSIESQTQEQIYELKDVMLSIILENALNHDTDHSFLNSSCIKLISILIDNFNWFSNEKVPHSSKEIYRDRFLRTIDYCYENYKGKITLKDLAEREHVNENYFSQVMKKSSYNSFSNMLNAVRCWIAENYLLESDHSIAAISEMCGFSDQKYFYSNFEKLWGMRPGQLRKWYHDYCQEPEVIKTVENDLLITTLKEHISLYHLNKLKYTCNTQNPH